MFDIARYFRPVHSKSFTNPISVGRRNVPKPPGILYRPGIAVASAPGDDYTQQFIHKITLDLSVARTLQQQNIVGTILWMYRVFNQADGSPNTTGFLAMRIGDLTADDLTWYAGNGMEGISYNKVFISNTAQAGVSCEIAYFQDTADKPARFF